MMFKQHRSLPMRPNYCLPEVSRVEERLEDYLDHLCAPLLGVASYQERQEIRRETRTHLEMLMDEFGYEGLSPDEAAEAAFTEYGSPFQIGQTLAEALHQRHRPLSVSERESQDGTVAQEAARRNGRRILRFAGSAPLVAFVCCGLTAGIGQAFLHYCMGGAPHEQWALYPGVVAFGLIAPVVSGLIIGSIVPARGVSATLQAHAFVVPHAVLAGLLLLPQVEGLWFAALQTIYGLPAALLAVCGGEAIARYRRLQWFWGKEGREWSEHSATASAAR